MLALRKKIVLHYIYHKQLQNSTKRHAMLKKIRPAREDINYEPLIYNECDENELLESEAIDYYYDEMLGDYDEDDKNEVNDGYDF